MLEESFIFLKGVGQKREMGLWRQGVATWQDFLNAPKVGMGSTNKADNDRIIRLARKCLQEEESRFFKGIFPVHESWRLYNAFKQDIVFLDIETSGYYSDITMIGMFDGKEVKTFVKGENLTRNQVAKELRKAKVLVTYNGASFDLPVIERRLGIKVEVPHVDLRSVCSQLKLFGGLKEVEKILGVKRKQEVQSVTGADAVYLWQMWKGTGDRKYLQLLKTYNTEDVVNLKPIAERCIPELWKKRREAVTQDCNQNYP